MNTRNVAHPALGLLLLLGLMGAAPVTGWAQEAAQDPSLEMREDFSDDEIKSFIKANEKVTVIQMEAERNMVQAIEEEGLTVERFHEILEQQRDPVQSSETSAAELESFNNAAEVILKENERIEKEMMSSIEEEGIDVETYKQIMIAYQQNPSIQERVNEFFRKEN